MENKFLNILGIISVIATVISAYFLTKEKTNMKTGISAEEINASINPGEDFYDYATLNWRKANPIPADYTRFGTFETIEKNTSERVLKIIESDKGKIGTLYKLAMDEERLNNEKTKPLQKYLDEIDSIQDKSEIPAFIGKMHSFSSPFWGDTVALDEKDSEHFLYNIYQAGTGLSRDYYFDEDEKTVKARQEYKKYMTKQMKNFGIDVNVEELYKLEERMAKSFYKKEKLRDPHANYHKMTISEVKSKFTGFDWDAYLKNRGATKAKFINICQPEAIQESINIINDTELSLLKNYLKYTLINSASALLDDTTYEIAFDFYNKTLTGQQEPKPRWRRTVRLLNSTLGEEIGHLYVKKYFPESAKERMETLVSNLQKAYKIRIENLTWMSDETKKQALEKLSTFKAKIGYPDKWRDYSKLEIKEQDSLWENIVQVSKFEDAFWINKIEEKNDPTLWYMNAHEINAYYDPTTNEICFPAGILQYPFFDMEADDAFNYGAIGSIIGHEMTHGFDDSGRKFDKDGNLRDWWTEKDSENFEEKAKVMKDFFKKIEVLPGIYANAEFTQGENLADYGGITISYTAFKNFGVQTGAENGLTADQRFFISYAKGWAQNIREEEALRLTKTDEHSLTRWRVNGILPHINAWYDAFNIKPTDKMYIAPENRVQLW